MIFCYNSFISYYRDRSRPLDQRTASRYAAGRRITLALMVTREIRSDWFWPLEAGKVQKLLIEDQASLQFYPDHPQKGRQDDQEDKSVPFRAGRVWTGKHVLIKWSKRRTRQDICETGINPGIVVFEEELNKTEDIVGGQAKYENWDQSTLIQ